jgi:glycolate oxidase FAD binding subunit
VIEPETAEEIAAVLASASQRRAAVVIRGGGTKIAWGRTPAPIDIVLDTRRLNKVVAHEYADLTATMQAGARIEDVNRELARHGQWVPIESPFEGATIGGAIATNDSGPLRHRYGTPRDLVIGVRLALTDGRLIKAGGNVVKNVAGYDLGKLVSGSFGSLAAIVSATFKLMPLPAASSTLIATFDSAGALVAALAAITGSQLEAAACEVHVSYRPAEGASEARRAKPEAAQYRLLLKFESTPGALNAHVQRARALIGGAKCDLVTAATESDTWRDYSRSVWQAPGIIVKASWLPASAGGVLAFIDDMRGSATDVEVAGRGALGSGLFRIDDDASRQRAAVERMRSRSDLFRHVVLLRADTGLKQHVDAWGSLGDAGPIGGAIKHALDPHGILNAGRGPI